MSRVGLPLCAPSSGPHVHHARANRRRSLLSNAQLHMTSSLLALGRMSVLELCGGIKSEFLPSAIAAYSRHLDCGKRKPCLQRSLLQHRHRLMYSLSHISDDPQQPRRANYSVDRCEYRAQGSDICGCNENTFRCTVVGGRTTLVFKRRYCHRLWGLAVGGRNVGGECFLYWVDDWHSRLPALYCNSFASRTPDLTLSQCSLKLLL